MGKKNEKGSAVGKERRENRDKGSVVGRKR
jgi:hypothetical protein